MFFGLMIKHHRVQIAPVAVRATFWVRESFSAGRVKSAIPEMTIPHYVHCVSEYAQSPEIDSDGEVHAQLGHLQVSGRKGCVPS